MSRFFLVFKQFFIGKALIAPLTSALVFLFDRRKSGFFQIAYL